MRVKFLRDYRGDKGEESYTKGQVIHLDQGVADMVIEAGAAKEFPLSDAEVAEQARKYYAGDDLRTERQIKDRIPQIVALQGDTREAVEQQRGSDSPHEQRKEDAKVAEKAAETKIERMKAAGAETAEPAKADAARK